MEAINTWNIIVLVIAAVITAIPILKMIRSIKSDKITLTRRDTGKSVTISRQYDAKVSKRLFELVD